MTDTTKKDAGGRPTRVQEAETKHIKSQAKIDLAMAKLVDPAIAQLVHLVSTIKEQKTNHQMALIDQIMSYNKDYMKAKLAAEEELNSKKGKPTSEEVWTPPSLDLSGSEKTIN